MIDAGVIMRAAEETLRKSEHLDLVIQHMQEGVAFFESRGITSPSKEDFRELESQYRASGEKKTAANRRREVERLYDWLNKEEEQQLSMNLEEAELPSPVVTSLESECMAAPKPKARGRKVLDPSGEKRTEKVMLYLTASLMFDVRDLANLYGKSITDYIIGLLERETESKQGKLALFRELRDNE